MNETRCGKHKKKQQRGAHLFWKYQPKTQFMLTMNTMRVLVWFALVAACNGSAEMCHNSVRT
jgi:hypothetical protein